jgi:hypothetical protein
MESEKKEIERKTAQLFLNLFNQLHNTHFEIQELREIPDVQCCDTETGKYLFLEIAMLENLPGEIAYGFGRAKKPISPTTKTDVVDFFADVVPQYRKCLEKKLLSTYGDNTALVLYQTSILWEPSDWEIIAPGFRKEILEGKETHFYAGVWVICTNNMTWPATDTLFCISPPMGGSKEIDRSV